MNREDFNDMAQALLDDDSGAGSERRARYSQGANKDDTRDSKGEPLRPAYNEAGEPWWM